LRPTWKFINIVSFTLFIVSIVNNSLWFVRLYPHLDLRIINEILLFFETETLLTFKILKIERYNQNIRIDSKPHKLMKSWLANLFQCLMFISNNICQCHCFISCSNLVVMPLLSFHSIQNSK
jgi:hypothetical protein